MDNRTQISDDGGKTFRRMNEKDKHGDNHSINFKKDDPNYILIGTDGGIYETYDLCKNWRYMENLPITQFYDIAVDDAEPFYNVYGGTQDNSTEGGPSRTDNIQGIQNSDWKVVLNWDGHQPATEPGNPNIVYAQRQQGTLSRLDMASGEVMDIQPQPGADEDYERYNWDAPILVSSHDPAQLFFASQRVWRSDNRGDSWTAISGDLTRNENRFELPIMGKQQSIDNAWDVYAMSNYNTISMVDQSPVDRGVIYAGTDDGLLSVTADGGDNWSSMEVSRISGVPKRAYVNDIKADLFDGNVAYMAMDNHKEGDYRPFIFKTSNRGKTWKSISANLPKNTIVWRIVQDHVDPNLLFIGTEFGVYCTKDGGGSWAKMTGGMPTISVRDIKIQRRENDLVVGTFGRSIYILDDYTSLRHMSSASLNKSADLYPLRDAWWYIPRSDLGFNKGRGSQGSSHFVADNPPFGAVFTYHIKEGFKSKKALRKELEKKKANQNIPFPGWDALDEEENEAAATMWLAISDEDGQLVRRLPAATSKGLHRTAWDLRHPSTNLVNSTDATKTNSGFMVLPGKYAVQLMGMEGDKEVELSEQHWFNVKQLRETTLKGASKDVMASTWQKYTDLQKEQSTLNHQLNKLDHRAKLLARAIVQTPANTSELTNQLSTTKQDIQSLLKSVYGSPSKRKPGSKTRPTIGARMFNVSLSLNNSTYGPTETNKMNMTIIEDELQAARKKHNVIIKSLEEIETKIIEKGGPSIAK
jgi:photosystem II stability/assembly factor-like uncharacterized protein